ncbi:Uncharacterised protein [Enterobacter cloacae]|nr:Uncharacterised protein [Enterobacter cloacae]
MGNIIFTKRLKKFLIDTTKLINLYAMSFILMQ